jgi:hypothetical protein
LILLFYFFIFFYFFFVLFEYFYRFVRSSHSLDGAYITQNQYDTFAGFHTLLQQFYSVCTTYPYIISQMNVPTLNDNPVEFKQPHLASLSPQQQAEMQRLALENQQRQAMETQRQQVAKEKEIFFLAFSGYHFFLILNLYLCVLFFLSMFNFIWLFVLLQFSPFLHCRRWLNNKLSNTHNSKRSFKHSKRHNVKP